jgi:hypothetical protein
MKTVADYLRNTPKGIKLYSPIFGECEFDHVSLCDSIYVYYKDTQIEFNKYGQFGLNNSDGECLLFPSKEVREWNNYRVPVRYGFEPFDKVVVRDKNLWHIDLFERYSSDNEFPYECLYHEWKCCLPFNEETAKLIGTSNDYAG